MQNAALLKIGGKSFSLEKKALHIAVFFHISPVLSNLHQLFSPGKHQDLLGHTYIPLDPGPVSYFLPTALQRATWPNCGQSGDS